MRNARWTRLGAIFGWLMFMALAGCTMPTPKKPKPLETEGLNPAQTVSTFCRAVREQRPVVLWRLLPASYQSGLNRSVQVYASKYTAENWSRQFQVMEKAVKVFRKKEKIILEAWSQQTGRSTTFVYEGFYRKTLEAVEALTSDQTLRDHATMEQFDLTPFVEQDGKVFLEWLDELVLIVAAKTGLSLNRFDFDVIKSSEDKDGVIELVVQDAHADTASSSLLMVSVDDRWVPLVVDEYFQKELAALPAMSEVDSKANEEFSQELDEIDKFLDKLSKANTPRSVIAIFADHSKMLDRLKKNSTVSFLVKAINNS